VAPPEKTEEEEEEEDGSDAGVPDNVLNPGQDPNCRLTLSMP
jgi:hypothetical protein